MQLLRYIYKHKAIPTDTIYYPIVAAQGSHFANGIDEVLVLQTLILQTIT